MESQSVLAYHRVLNFNKICRKYIFYGYDSCAHIYHLKKDCFLKNTSFLIYSNEHLAFLFFNTKTLKLFYQLYIIIFSQAA